MSDSARNGWETCPPGEFARLSARLRAHHRRRDAVRATVGLVAAVLVGSVGYQAWAMTREYQLAGLSCAQVMAMARDYTMGTLEPGVREQVRQHVSACPHCKPLFWMMRVMGYESDRPIDVGPATVPGIEPGEFGRNAVGRSAPRTG